MRYVPFFERGGGHITDARMQSVLIAERDVGERIVPEGFVGMEDHSAQALDLEGMAEGFDVRCC